jgi:hypothetical protein
LRNRFKPFGKLCSRIQAPWPGQLQLFLLSFCWVLLLMSGLGERFKNRISAIQRSVSPTSHTLLSTVFLLYHSADQSARGDYDVGAQKAFLIATNLGDASCGSEESPDASSTNAHASKTTKHGAAGFGVLPKAQVWASP